MPQRVVYLQHADKSVRPAWRPLRRNAADQWALIASEGSLHDRDGPDVGRANARLLLRLPSAALAVVSLGLSHLTAPSLSSDPVKRGSIGSQNSVVYLDPAGNSIA